MSHQLRSPRRGGHPIPLEQGYVQPATKLSSAWLRCLVAHETGTVGEEGYACIDFVGTIIIEEIDCTINGKKRKSTRLYKRQVPFQHKRYQSHAQPGFLSKPNDGFAAEAHMLAQFSRPPDLFATFSEKVEP